VYENIKKCTCEDGCPCCVGKPLRKFTVWNVERGEAAIPSKASTLMILEGLLGDYSNLNNPDTCSLVDTTADDVARLERALRRRLETTREPKVFHPIEPNVKTEYPDIEKADELPKADVQRRSEIRRSLDRDLRKRIAKKLDEDKINPNKSRYEPPPPGMTGPGGVVKPTAFPGKPAEKEAATGGRGDGAKMAVEPEGNPLLDKEGQGEVINPPKAPVQTGDSLAARARRLKKLRGDGDEKS
jgi:hypothetical protein